MAQTLLLAGVGERIGTGVARRFDAAGWQVALVSRSGTEDLADGLDSAVSIRADITDESAVERAVTETREAFGGVDCLVCNASGGGGNPIESADATTLERLWRVRALGTFHLVQACLEDLREGGTVLVSGTTFASEPAPEQVEWASAAPATRGLARTFDDALDGVQVTYVEIATAVRPPDSDFAGAVGSDELADRYLELAQASGAVPTRVRLDTQ
ncbi:MAG: SDR family oxidoreductase [Halobacteriales archaeon]|nr:SDR family oxidoreductase [Halobacteriales archaeon]